MDIYFNALSHQPIQFAGIHALGSVLKPITKCLFVAIAVFANSASAKTNAECLKHLGGGYSDAVCFAGLRANIDAQNRVLYKKIGARIPRGNPHARMLDDYMSAQDAAVRFCELQRDAGAKWEKSPDGTMYPALYEQCVFDLRKVQNRFLKDLLTAAKW